MFIKHGPLALTCTHTVTQDTQPRTYRSDDAATLNAHLVTLLCTGHGSCLLVYVTALSFSHSSVDFPVSYTRPSNIRFIREFQKLIVGHTHTRISVHANATRSQPNGRTQTCTSYTVHAHIMLSRNRLLWTLVYAYVERAVVVNKRTSKIQCSRSALWVLSVFASRAANTVDYHTSTTCRLTFSQRFLKQLFLDPALFRWIFPIAIYDNGAKCTDILAKASA